jgi:formate/nitrite transporter FocA (FNT family)
MRFNFHCRIEGEYMASSKSEVETPTTSDDGQAERHAPVNTPAVGTRLSADEIYENVRIAAEEELHRPSIALWWSAIAAGLTIGFSFFAAAYLATLVPEPMKHAAAAVGYPLGFIFVVLARSQLFTENTLEPIIPLLHTPSWSTLRSLLSLWFVVLFGNMVGTIIFAWITARTPIVEPEFKRSLLEVAEEATVGGFALVTYRAIYAGWLIALMAWLVASTRATGAQLVLIWLTTAPIAAFGFRHSIAGSVEAFYRALMGTTGWIEMVVSFIIPALAGNIIGGILFVALLNHGQVAASRAVTLKLGEGVRERFNK